MFACGVLMLIFILMRRSRRYLHKTKREQKRRVARPAAPNRDRSLIDAPPEVLRWQVEMHDTARDLKAELDSKIGALQAVVRIAGEESSRLEAAIARAERLGISSCRDTLQEIEDLAEVGASQSPLPEINDEIPIGREAHHDRIYALAERGLPPAAIAEQTGATLGDVEMLLSLKSP
jgi:hypothetical protein